MKLQEVLLMKNKVIGKCPICGEKLEVKALHCKNCDTTIEGNFELSVFDRLSEVQTKFLMIFLKHGGNIKLVEKELGVSYPTVKKILDEINAILGVESKFDRGDETKDDILRQLRKGEISFEEASVKLERIGEVL